VLYKAGQAERQYHAVEPENRLVARTLARRWEDALRALRQAEVEYEDLRQSRPAMLTAAEQDRIRSLSSDLPAL
jgi:hypothetical protein